MGEQISFILGNASREARPLAMGGTDAAGNAYTVDNISLLENGRRLLPIMGEFHYSRWEKEGWEEELLKMKAGGIEIIATYVFWNHHEEAPSEWDFTGRRDIGSFVRLCGRLGLKVWLRIGPWVHAEARHGGFPDHIQWAKDFTPRTNDEGYLQAVEEFWRRLREETKGCMAHEGGPVIGIQLENEYGHVGGPEDPEVRHRHMDKLKEMAIAAGFVAPYYCATGWGDAYVTEETFPMMGGYVDAPWATDTRPLPASKNYLFRRYRNDPSIGTDGRRQQREEALSSQERFPYFTAELGAGLQVTSHRRPVVSAADTEANLLCMLGSGCNLIGYYMYHGGINPQGRYTTLNETQEIGGWTTLPAMSYDFQAPVNEAGRLNASYGALKKHHFLVHDYADVLAAAEPVFPEAMPESPEDMTTPRMVLRADRESGTAFLFVNNHQRNRRMACHEAVEACIRWPKAEETKLSLHLPKGTMGILPLNLPMKDGLLLSTNAYLLGRVGERLFFYTDGWVPGFCWRRGREEGLRYDVPPCVSVISREEADRAFRFGERLYITRHPDSCLILQEGELSLLTEEKEESITVYRADGQKLAVPVQAKTTALPQAVFTLRREEREEDGTLAFREYAIHMSGIPAAAHEAYLIPGYLGDRAELYRDGVLIDDWYTTGKPWHIALKRFGYPAELTLRIYPSDRPIPCKWGKDVYYDEPVPGGCLLKDLSVSLQQKIAL